MDIKNLQKTLLVWLVLFLLFSLVFQSCQEKEVKEDGLAKEEIGLQTSKDEYKENKEVLLTIQNNLDKELTIKNECPGEPFDVFRIVGTEKKQMFASPRLKCDEEEDYVIESKNKSTISYKYWNHSLFGNTGRYIIEYTTDINGETKTFTSNEFEVVQGSTITYLWRTLLYQPIYNVLIFFASIIPGHSLGIAIILLTILIRLILLIPSQKGLRAQRKMQEVQPRLEKIKEKYKGNQEKIAKETMAIWKEHKVSPASSCLPILLQFPILIALFYVIKDGLNPDTTYLLYPQLKDFPLENIDVMFLNYLDLTKVNVYILPVIVGGLQFFQMKLATHRKKSKDEKDKKKDKSKDKKPEMKMATEMMTYVMPILIAVFTASVPAGVGLYWGTSTIFGIVQQFFVNKESSSNKKDKDKKDVNKYGKPIIDQ